MVCSKLITPIVGIIIALQKVVLFLFFLISIVNITTNNLFVVESFGFLPEYQCIVGYYKYHYSQHQQLPTRIMTWRPILPITNNFCIPIMTTYRKRLLVVFNEATTTTKDNIEVGNTSGVGGDINALVGVVELRNIQNDIDIERALTGNTCNDATTNSTTTTNTTHVPTWYDIEYQFLKQVSTLSSSPERLCIVAAMTQNCTIHDIYKIRSKYNTATQQLNIQLSNPKLLGHVKHQIHCTHRYIYGRQPMVCHSCWSYLPICICHKQVQQQSQQSQEKYDANRSQLKIDHNDPDSIFRNVPQFPIPKIDYNIRSESSTIVSSSIFKKYYYDTIDVIMWTHHKEWGSPSNTGSVLNVALQHLYQSNQNYNTNNHNNNNNHNKPINGYMLMKGYDIHDQQLETILQTKNENEIVIPLVLWAASDETKNNSITNTNETDSTTIADVMTSSSNKKNNKEIRFDVRTPTSKRQFVSIEQLQDELETITTNTPLSSSSTTDISDNDRMTSTSNDDTVSDTATATAPTTSKPTLGIKKSIRLVIIAVEGTWSQAKRMVTKLPLHVRALHLSDHELFHWRIDQDHNTHADINNITTSSTNDDNKQKTTINNITHQDNKQESIPIYNVVSMLDPLRKQKTLNHYPSKKKKKSWDIDHYDDDHEDEEEDTAATAAGKIINSNKVCTVEATVSALVALNALSTIEGHYILNITDQKIIRTVTYQGKMTLRNIISHW